MADLIEEMTRRDYVKTVLGAGGTGLLAGCLNNSDSGGSSGQTPGASSGTLTSTATAPGTDSGTATETATDTPTDTATPTETTTSGKQVYKDNLPEGGDEIFLRNTEGELTLEELAARELDREYGEEAQNAGNAVEAMEAVFPVLYDVYTPHRHKAMQYFTHNNIGFPEEYFSVDNIRINHDINSENSDIPLIIANPAEDADILNQPYVILPVGTSTEGNKYFAPIQMSPWFQIGGGAGYDVIDFENLEEDIEYYHDGNWDEISDETNVRLIENLERTLSYENSTDWLTPTKRFHDWMGHQQHEEYNGFGFRDKVNRIRLESDGRVGLDVVNGELRIFSPSSDYEPKDGYVEPSS